MDPNSCLLNLLRCIQSGYDDGATDAIENLTEWCMNGGFPPDWLMTIRKFMGYDAD